MERWQLQQLKALPLDVKVRKTQERIKEWYEHFNGQVYVSFSGGKDSTVLLHIAREMYPDIEAVFVDTGLEYPEIREFVKSFDNVTWLKPKMNFKEVVEKVGYPIISKEVANVIEGARKGSIVRKSRINGSLKDKKGNKSQFNCEKYSYLLDAQFKISDKCCYYIKKQPTHNYTNKSGRKPIIGMMASESDKRLKDYLKTGCNAFDLKLPQSQPLGFWTEQDILKYINNLQHEFDNTLHLAGTKCKTNLDKHIRRDARKYLKSVKWKRIEIASCYGEIIESDQLEGQTVLDGCMSNLTTSKCKRTGCMFCMFGVHLEKSPNRFEMMKETHPKQYDYCINKLGLGEVLDYIGVKY